ncbi:carcinoembryonic antigen-related cell adhesion molecule 1-like [Clinocottus analis]|uniref:carcinoembryonic antigen-related cell adhesion molecule 1-like n=1 Tax=Clinocottus analis TaxID=304258 RepID=UPI0035BF2F3A
MDILPLLCAVAVSFTGLTRGVGVLPDGPLNAAVGGTVMFTTTVTPSETPFLVVQWKFGYNNIITFNINNITAPEYESRITLFMSTGSLELRNLALNDSGEYSVGILPPGEVQKDGRTSLVVHEKVSNITVTASSTDLVESSSSVRLSCSSIGSSLSFLWINGSSEVTASDRVQLTDGGSTLTMNVTRYDQGPFSCRVSNLVSHATSDQIHLTISYGPENMNLILYPTQKYHEKGSDISMVCSADSSPAAHFTWLLNGDLQSGTEQVLNLTNIQESQSGNYSCRASNSKTLRNETSQPSVVSILVKISDASITWKTNQSIEGKSFNLSCDAAGSVFNREWRKGDVGLTPDDNMALYDKNRVLSFNSLSKKDTGDYFCKVSNPLSQDEVKYTMVVSYGPENVQIKGPSSVQLKETLTLTCSADSLPAAYIWMLNGTKIHNSSVLTKDNIEHSHHGDYICEVMNHITGRRSSASHTVSVTEKSKCSDGCIAGIVIAVLAVCAVLCGGGYMFYTKNRNLTKKLTVRDPPTEAGAEGQDNNAYAGTQEVKYADISIFQKANGGTVHLVSQSNSSDYAEIRVNNKASSASTNDAHLQRMKKPAPQPHPEPTQLYAHVQKK